MNANDNRPPLRPGRPGRRDLAAVLAKAVVGQLRPPAPAPGLPFPRRRSADFAELTELYAELDAEFWHEAAS